MKLYRNIVKCIEETTFDDTTYQLCKDGIDTYQGYNILQAKSRIDEFRHALKTLNTIISDLEQKRLNASESKQRKINKEIDDYKSRFNHMSEALKKLLVYEYSATKTGLDYNGMFKLVFEVESNIIKEYVKANLKTDSELKEVFKNCVRNKDTIDSKEVSIDDCIRLYTRKVIRNPQYERVMMLTKAYVAELTQKHLKEESLEEKVNNLLTEIEECI